MDDGDHRMRAEYHGPRIETRMPGGPFDSPRSPCEDGPMTKNRVLSALLSLALSVVLLAVLIRQLRAGDLPRTLARIYLPALAVYAALTLLSAGLRALRYRWLLRPRRIAAPDIVLVTLVRNAFDDLLPARLGSLSYIYMLNKRLGFSFESAAASFVVAFVFDFLTLGPFVVLAVAAVGAGPAALHSGPLLGAALAFMAVTALAVWKLVPLLGFAIRVYARLLRSWHLDRRRGAAASLAKLNGMMDALRDIRGRKMSGRIFLVSLLIRLGKYLSLYALLFALLRSQGLGLNDLSFAKTILGITGAEMTSALPIKGLADFGTWESAWALSFRLMGFDPRWAVVSGIGVHLITNLFEYGLGLAAFFLLSRPRRKRSVPPDPEPMTPPES